jgi:hypothetical protein
MTIEKEIRSYWIKSEDANTGDVFQQEQLQQKLEHPNTIALTGTNISGNNSKRITKRKQKDDDDDDIGDGSDTRTMPMKANKRNRQISLKLNQGGTEDKKKARGDKISSSDGFYPPLTDTHCSDGMNVERDTMTRSSKPPPPSHSVRPPERAPTENAPSLTSSIITDKSKCQYDHLCKYLFCIHISLIHIHICLIKCAYE